MRAARSRHSAAPRCRRGCGAPRWKVPAPGMLRAGGWDRRVQGCDPHPVFMGTIRHCTALPETPLPSPSRHRRWGLPRQLPFVPTRHRGRESPPQPCCFAMGLISPCVGALRAGSGSRGPRGGNGWIPVYPRLFCNHSGGVNPRAGLGCGMRLRVVPHRSETPDPGQRNPEFRVPPSLQNYSEALSASKPPPGRSGPQSRGRDGAGETRGRRAGCGHGSGWLRAHRSPAGPEEGEYKKSTLNIITRLRFGSASRPVTPPSPSSPRRADGRDARGRWGSANAGVFSVIGCVPPFARPVRRGWDAVPTAPPTLGLANAPVTALAPRVPNVPRAGRPVATPKDTKVLDLKRFRIQQGNSPPTPYLHGFDLLPLPSVAKRRHGAVPQFPHS